MADFDVNLNWCWLIVEEAHRTNSILTFQFMKWFIIIN